MALKILPDAFADDPDRLARFTREAQILASLNHPNFAAIHGIEEAEGTRALAARGESPAAFGGMILPMRTDTLSAALAPIELPDPDGQPVRLGSLWEDGPSVLVFLRHYG
ncbi:MAG: hypothetical protein E2P06_13690 [Acidobacteria bacterium]|nr:MAG: hypothetical protein E2P06_13690 [Acidobacteriota bacterium]